MSRPTPQRGPLGDAEREKRRQTRAALRERAIANGMRHLLSTADGRVLYRHIVAVECAVFAPSFHPNGSEQSRLAGRRDVGINLEALARKHAKTDWLRSFAEALDAEDREETLEQHRQETDT